MTSDSDLRDLLVHAVDDAPELDTEQLSARLGQRRRRRQTGRALTAIGSLVIVATLAFAAFPLLQRDGVELASPVAVAAFDGIRGESAPTMLPDGARACDPADHALGSDPTATIVAADPAVTTTWFCADDLDVVLQTGPHATLPETGERLAVARRDGFVQRNEGTTSLTVSDGNSIDDVHYRLLAGAPVSTQTLVRVMESIPAIERAPFANPD